MAKKRGLQNIYLHCFLDGRDTPPQSGADYVRQLEAYLQNLGVGRIATVMGRYYAMDRDKRWERVGTGLPGYRFRGRAKICTADLAVTESYAQGINDEFMKPAVIWQNDELVGNVRSGDSLIFYNFRADRAREITNAFVAKDFNFFDRGPLPPKVNFVCMTNYDEKIKAPRCFWQTKPWRIF